MFDDFLEDIGHMLIAVLIFAATIGISLLLGNLAYRACKNWVFDSETSSDPLEQAGDSGLVFYCANCEIKVAAENDVLNHCPNCGAKMDR